MAGQAAGVGEGAAEEEFDLGVGGAELVGGPAGEGVVDGGVQPEQDAFALAHRGSAAAATGQPVAGQAATGGAATGGAVAGWVVTGRGCRC